MSVPPPSLSTPEMEDCGKAAPLVSVVLVTWNGEDLLRAHLPSLQKLDYPNYEVIVVDNASTDGSVAFLRTHYPEFKVVVNEKNLGTAEGSNLAIPHCRGEYVFWVSNDMEFDRGILSHLVRWCEEDERIGIATVKMLRIKEGRRVGEIDSVGADVDLFGFPASRGINEIDRGQYDAPAEVFFSFGGALLIRRSVLDLVGGYDPDYFTLGDDIDLSWRVRLAGYRVVVEPKAFLYHRVSATLSKSHNRPQKRYLSERNTLCTLLKNYSAGYLAGIIPLCGLLLLMEMVFYAILLKGGMILAVLTAVGWNLRNLRRTLAKRRAVQRARLVRDGNVAGRMLKRSEKIRLFLDYLFHRREDRWKYYF